MQYQIISPENMHTSKITQTEKVIHRNIHICAFTYMCVTINEKKEAIDLKDKRGMQDTLEERKKREKCYNHNLKIKKRKLY